MISEETLEPVKPTLPRRKWFQFGLRSLLLFTTVAGCLFGWLAKEWRQSATEKLIAKNLEERGWFVEFDDFDISRGTRRKGWWQSAKEKVLGKRVIVAYPLGAVDQEFVKRLNELKSLKALVIRSNTDVNLLAGLENLEVLLLESHDIQDLTPFGRLKQLKRLRIQGSSIKHFVPLAKLRNLEDLFVEIAPSVNVTPLAELSKLKRLTIHGHTIDNLAPLSRLRELEYLSICVKSLEETSPIAALSKLSELELTCASVENFTPLTKLTNLKKITIYNANVSDERMRALKEALPNCTSVSMATFSGK